MTGRAGSVVATAASALAGVAMTLLGGCGQKGALIAAKPAASAVVAPASAANAALPPDAATAPPPAASR